MGLEQGAHGSGSVRALRPTVAWPRAAPCEQVAERVKTAGWQVSGDIVTLPKNEQNSPVVVKRTVRVLSLSACCPGRSQAH